MPVNPIRKIVIIGPESTGKSTLSAQLAAHFDTRWCPEYAREYLLKHGTQYTYRDLLTIAKGQAEMEDRYIRLVENSSQSPAGNTPSLLFIDTDMYVMKVWCEFVFGKCHPFVLEQIASRKYDLYLLCNVDLPWVRDELREYPDLETRQKLYNVYREIMEGQSVPWVDISGDYDERFRKAVKAVNNLLH